MGLLLAPNEQLRSAEPARQNVVNVYVENIPGVPWTMERAKATTAHIYSAIGVKLIWADLHQEHAASQDGTIVVKFSTATPVHVRPRALAQSFPYEGTHAQVFYDRVGQTVTPSLFPTLLGYVLAHEIGHLLEGTNGHSDRGVMKACWDARDYDLMARELLTFTDLDVRLIYAGLDARSKRIASSAEAP
jgi:hypothetical protein